MSAPHPDNDRRRDLQADRALFGLTEAEERELAALEPGRDLSLPDEFELAAAALDVGLSVGDEAPLPAHLHEKILAASRSTPAIALASSLPTPGQPWRRRELLGWLAAAAATLVAIIVGARQPRPATEPTPAELRDELLALQRERPNDVVQVAWTRGEDAAGAAAEGDVVWSDSEQRGVMRFRGLAANDPTRTQYQLWIFDPTQDERYPVDGGVFDVPAGVAEVLVPINAKLPVTGPTLFAITVEKPGGVVVSDRSRLPLLAQVER